MTSNNQLVCIYINEGDEWRRKPLHLEILTLLHHEGLAGATVVHAVAGFTKSEGVHTSSLVDTGGQLPLIIQFVDSAERVSAVLPRVREMAPHRLITVQPVEVYR